MSLVIAEMTGSVRVVSYKHETHHYIGKAKCFSQIAQVTDVWNEIDQFRVCQTLYRHIIMQKILRSSSTCKNRYASCECRSKIKAKTLKIPSTISIAVCQQVELFSIWISIKNNALCWPLIDRNFFWIINSVLRLNRKTYLVSKPVIDFHSTNPDEKFMVKISYHWIQKLKMLMCFWYTFMRVLCIKLTQCVSEKNDVFASPNLSQFLHTGCTSANLTWKLHFSPAMK